MPKKIHYCWFGRGEKSKLINKCIASWKKYCPDYEIIEWNEDNFDVNINKYVSEAYSHKKYAFVSDYARLYALYNKGGIYLDTDVELLKNPDFLLENIAFSGFESESYVATWCMGGEKEFSLWKELMDYYNKTSFVKENGELDTTSNVKILTEKLINKGISTDGKFQVIEDFKIYPPEYFSPFENSTGIMRRTENTVCIHWYDKSWIDKGERLRSIILRPIHRIFGENCFEWLKK